MAQQFKVVLDTNALLYIERFKTDLFDEIKRLLGKTSFYVTEKVLKELKNKMNENKSLAREARIALKLMKKNFVKKIKIEGKNADETLENAAKQGFIVVTNDAELKRKIKKIKGQIICLSKRKKIVLR